MVDRATRRRDHDIDPAAEAAQLLPDRLAAVDGHDPGAERLAIDVEGLGDLHGELAGRDDDEGAGAVGSGRADRDALEDRQREGRGLAGAGRRLGEDVAAAEQQRDGLALDRRRLLVAQVGDRGEQALVEVEAGEAVGGGRSRCGGCDGVGASLGAARASDRASALGVPGLGLRGLGLDGLRWGRLGPGDSWHRTHCGRIPVRGPDDAPRWRETASPASDGILRGCLVGRRQCELDSALFVVVLAMAGLAACESTDEPGPRAIDGVFPPTAELPQLPFRVADLTGSVRAVSIGTRMRRWKAFNRSRGAMTRSPSSGSAACATATCS